MPRKVSSIELQSILKAISLMPEGGSLHQIEAALETPPNRRNLQRRLASLVAEKQLILEGVGRGARYRISDSSPTRIVTLETPVSAGKEGIALSTVAQSLRESVRNPIHLRVPVGYNRKFLDEYRPNVTEYLPSELRHELAELGQFPEGDSPAGTYARHIFNRLLIDLSWNSSRLEGNTYSLLETQRLLEIGASAEGKTIEDTQMILNHKAAIEMLVEEAESIGFNRYTILNLHGLLSENLLDDPRASGSLRESPVGISGTVYHPLEIPQVIKECFDQILATADAIQDPFEQAFFAMVHLPYLQPFQDVNKRVSRLATNIPLIRFNLCPLSFVDVPQRDYVDGMLAVYELSRIELLREVFTWAYKRSCQRYSAVRQVLGEPDPFRLRYREPLKKVVGEVVRSALDKPAATTLVRKHAADIPEQDRARFMEVAETELLSLHEGNFMRYRVRPSEFERWLANWR